MSGQENYIRILNAVQEYRQKDYIWLLIGYIFFCVVILVLPLDKIRKQSKRQKQKQEKRKKYHPYEAPSKKRPVLQFFSRHFKATVLSLFTVLSVIGFIYISSEIKKLQTDIERQDYSTYIGEFEYSQEWYRSRDPYWITIRLTDADGNVKTLSYPDKHRRYGLHTEDEPKLTEYGTYRGRLVYGKNSRVIVDLQVDPAT